MAHYAPTPAGTVYLTTDGLIVHSLPANARAGTPPAHVDRSREPSWTLTQRLVTSAPLTPEGAGAAAATVSSFLGNDPSHWHRSLPTHDQISLGEAWPGIAVSLTAHGDRVETFYTLAPGADVAHIAVAITGAESLSIEHDQLIAETGLGAVTLSRPEAWQTIHGKRHDVPVRYVLDDTHYGFQLGEIDEIDAMLAVVIDPVTQATYLGGGPNSLGGAGNNVAYALVVATDAIYIAGLTTSTDFPGTTGGAQALHGGMFYNDAFVAKLNPELTTLEQATFLAGAINDAASALALDADGNVVVSGTSLSANFPGTIGGAQETRAGNADAFVAKLNAELTTLTQATYLGGSIGINVGSVATSAGNALALGAGGQVYLAGVTSATDFPGTTGGAQEVIGGRPNDAFVARLNADLTTLDQATYLSGTPEPLAARSRSTAGVPTIRSSRG